MESAYDRALKEVGADGRYQKKFDILYGVVLGGLWCMSYMNLYLALAIPEHNCKLPEKPVNISFHEWKLKNVPVTSVDVDGETRFSSCLIYTDPYNSNETKECSEYEYDKTWYETTVPSENNWVCDKELYVAKIFTYSAISELIGNIVAGWFGDTYGRRLTYIFSLLLTVLGRFISVIFANTYWIFVSGIVIAAFPSWSILQSVAVISMEMSSDEGRTTAAVYRFTATSCGVSLLALFYWWLREWKILFIISTTSLLPFLFFSWKYIESPRWLWTHGKTQETVKQLKIIAKENKRKLKSETEQEILTSAMKNNETLGALALFSSKKLAINTVIQLIIWIILTIGYTVLIMMASQKKDGNPFLEVLWQSVIEIPGGFIGAFLANRYGRRFAGMASCAIAAFMWTFITLREIYLRSWIATWWAGLIFRSMCRVSCVTSFYIINLFNMELYPTCLRQSGMSLGNVLSSGSAAFAPYIIYLGNQVDPRLPGAILAASTLVGLISFFLLPETLNTKLPETLEDARRFGSRKKADYFSLPIKQSDATAK
ncbi:sugar transporter domain-containing protein [Phthorimaea operculella]|nr:sugar transporter domain-containing protein [Phthorimaea operculella]